MSVLHRVLDGARGPVLVVGDDLPEVGHPTLAPGDSVDEGQRLGTVVVVAADVAELRRLASLSRDWGRARSVVAVVGDAGAVVPLALHPGWPAATVLEARLEHGTAVTSVTFATRVRVDGVVAALARGAAPTARSGPGGLRVALQPDALALTPPIDVTVTTVLDPDAECPPDVVIGTGAEPAVSGVTGVPPVVVSVAEAGVPLDEAVFNPAGLRRDWARGVVDLPAGTRLTVGLVRSLRDAQAVRVPPDADPRLVAGLAMSGVPIVDERAGESVDLDDPDVRLAHAHERSRAATREHGHRAWRARLAERAGVRVAP